MKNKYLLLSIICIATTLFGFSHMSAAEKCTCQQTKTENKQCLCQGTCTFRQTEFDVKRATYGHIDAKALKILIDTKVPMILLDGRGNTKWDDGRRIPGAKVASHEFSLEEFEKLIPGKDDLVIVYCGAYECPLGKKLAAKLVTLGYKNVLEYPGGMKEWKDVAKYPTERDENIK